MADSRALERLTASDLFLLRWDDHGWSTEIVALSWAGELNLFAAADRDSCPDVEVFTHGVHTTLDDLA